MVQLYLVAVGVLFGIFITLQVQSAIADAQRKKRDAELDKKFAEMERRFGIGESNQEFAARMKRENGR